MSNEIAIYKQIKTNCELSAPRLGLNATFLNAELMSLKKLLTESPIKDCTPKSIELAFLNCQLMGFSINPMLGEVSLVPRNKQVVMMPHGPGFTRALIEGGVITGYSQPTIVYEGDLFEVESERGERWANHKECATVRTMDKVVAVYMYVHRTNGKSELYVFYRNQIEGWIDLDAKRKYENRMKPDKWGKTYPDLLPPRVKALETPQMLQSMCIKHALGKMPELKTIMVKRGVTMANVDLSGNADPEWQEAQVVDTTAQNVQQNIELQPNNEDLDV